MLRSALPRLQATTFIYKQKMVHFADQTTRADKMARLERVDGQTMGSVRGMQREIAAVMCAGCKLPPAFSLLPGALFPCFVGVRMRTQQLTAAAAASKGLQKDKKHWVLIVLGGGALLVETAEAYRDKITGSRPATHASSSRCGVSPFTHKKAARAAKVQAKAYASSYTDVIPQ